MPDAVGNGLARPLRRLGSGAIAAVGRLGYAARFFVAVAYETPAAFARLHLTVREIKRPELEATLVAEVVAEALEKRIAFRRAMKKAIQTTMQAGAKGVKVEINGRVGGSEMSRQAKEREGQVPLSTLRANVDYGTAEARTTWGVIGIKVWISKGDLEPGEKVDWRGQGEGTRPRRQPPERRASI